MFDAEHGGAPAAVDVARWRLALGRLGAPGAERLSEAACIDLIGELEDLKSAAAGAQAIVTAQLARARTDAEAAAGTPARERGKGLSHEVALARRVSPTRGGQHLGLATALTEDMPHTLAALRSGVLSEWRATLLVRESICLPREQRQAFDAALCADPTGLTGWGDRRLVAEARKVAYRLDPQVVLARSARAEKDRNVSIRPAPDTMTYVTALLPVGQGVSVFAALTAAADAARARGDARSRGQVMADTFAARITGREPAQGVPVAVEVVMPVETFLGHGNEPAHVTGHGTVPPAWARRLVADALSTGAGAWLRRLFTDGADHLVAMDSRARRAPEGLAHFIALRDGGTCRTPYCDAPIRHIDHVVPHAAGGLTAADNLQGLCEQCNYAKQATGWQATTTDGESASTATASGQGVTRGHTDATGPPGNAPPSGAPCRQAPPTVITTSPTGHTYTSPTPHLPRAGCASDCANAAPTTAPREVVGLVGV